MLVWLLRAFLLTACGNLLVREDQPWQADAIVVLGGDAFGTRILKGAELAGMGYASGVWVSEGVDMLGRPSFGTIPYAELYGYPASLFHPVFLPPDADSTRGEAIFIGKQLRARGIHNVLIVTSDFHTRRANYLWRNQNPWLRIAVIGASDPNFSGGWWKSREGQKTFLLESVKTMASRLGD